MRNLIALGAIAAATAFALPAQALSYLKIHGTRDSLTWHTGNGRALDLASPEGKGIHIERIEPAGYDGLLKGDLIVAADGQPMAHVVDLLKFANTHLQAPCKLTVQRGQRNMQVALPAGELAALVHPSP
jgi:S1-C subfamily serine protease